MIDLYNKIFPFIEKMVGKPSPPPKRRIPVSRRVSPAQGDAAKPAVIPAPSADTFDDDRGDTPVLPPHVAVPTARADADSGERAARDGASVFGPVPPAVSRRDAEPAALAASQASTIGAADAATLLRDDSSTPESSSRDEAGLSAEASRSVKHVAAIKHEPAANGVVRASQAETHALNFATVTAASSASSPTRFQVHATVAQVSQPRADRGDQDARRPAAEPPVNSQPDHAGGRSSHDDPLLGCLTILTRMTHQPFSADALTAGLPLVDNRLTPALFVRAAARAGLSARVVKRPLGKISALVLPAVLLLKDGQACILEKIRDDGSLRVIQPESGEGATVLAFADVLAQYNGCAIFVNLAYRFDDRSASSVIPRPHRWFWDTLKDSWVIYSEVLLASFLINFFALATPLFIMNVYDRVVPNNAIETLWVLSIGIAIVFGFDWVIRTLRGYFIDIASKRTDIVLSAMLFERVMGIRMAARPPSVGAFANNLQEFESLRDFFTSTTLTALVDLPFTILFILIIWMIGGPLAWIPVAVIPIAVLAGFVIQIPLGKTVEQLFRHSTQKHATLIECLTGLETIKSSGAEGTRQRLWEQAVGNIAKLSLRVRLLSAGAANTTAFLQQLATVIVVIAGVYLIGAGEMTIGALIACTLLTGRALAPLSQVAATLTRYHQAKASLQTITRLMEMPLERPAGKSFLHRPVFKGDIEFRSAVFSYPGQQVAALKGVSFNIQSGEHVAIIGRIGSGKSTIGRLVLGLYEPDGGSVLLDGTDIRQLDPADIRHNIGYVPQDIMLLYGSVRDNIVLGAPHADDVAVLRAADIAGVTRFVNADPAGFDRQVGERGEGLSGGQRQSVAVARALLTDAPILLMDEPSNAMDNRSEELLKQRLSLLLENKTLLLVTHRASLLSLVSRIIVMDGGSVVADGPKDDVMEALKQGKIKVSQ